MINVDRAVVGGGLFGCFAALTLAEQGHSVVLIEQNEHLLTRASMVNQARLHTGLHYPRSILTAREALSSYHEFRTRFAPAIHDFTQIYAIASHNSKTSSADFESFIERLGIQASEVNPNTWFNEGSVDRAYRVEEPSFDVTILRQMLTDQLVAHPRIEVRTGVSLIGGKVDGAGVLAAFSDGSSVYVGGLIIAAYAGTNAIRATLGLSDLPILFELAEVLVGEVESELRDLGFTVMDGPFWSLMPFGKSGDVTLTSVGFTPLQQAQGQPIFPCQEQRASCSPLHLHDCTTCPVHPPSAQEHHQQQMALFLKSASAFTPRSSLMTVKAVLKSTEVDDARPTLIHHEDDSPVTTILSGKVSTLFDLEGGLR